MFINISNHPSKNWGEEQIAAAVEAARISGREEIIDIPFPNVPPTVTERDLEKMAREITAEISPADVVHVMGEMGLTLKIANDLRRAGVDVVHSTTERVSVENGDGSKTVQFRFIQFRPYFYESAPSHYMRSLCRDNLHGLFLFPECSGNISEIFRREEREDGEIF